MMRPYHLVAPVPQAATLEPLVQTERTLEAARAVDGLMAPRPNPTASGASFRFTLREAGDAELEIFDVAGHRVRRVAGGMFGPGEHSLRWDGRNDDGGVVGSGVYFVNLRANGVSQTRKLIVTP